MKPRCRYNGPIISSCQSIFMKSHRQFHPQDQFLAWLSGLRPVFALHLACICGLSVAVSSCAWIDQPLGFVARSINPYRFELIQGNVITKEQLEVIRPGMSKNQVKEVLGTPLITSLFHEERWDYAFTVRRSGQEIQRKKLAVFFDKEQMLRFESDPLPSEAEFAATIDIRRPSLNKVPSMKATPEQLAGFKSAKTVEENMSDLSGRERGVVRSNYPPLEPK
jgi:outer membrane protein assembly factor BamE